MITPEHRTETPNRRCSEHAAGTAPAPLRSSAFTITSEPGALPGGGKILSQWREQNSRFVTPQGVASNDINDTVCPFNGTTYLQVLSNQTPLTKSTIDSTPFSLTSIDLAEYSTVFTSPKTISFTGTQAGGGTVAVTFVTDGVIDRMVHWQTFRPLRFRPRFPI
jgi:hypothetical protein